MINKEDYLKAKETVKKYEEQLRIADVVRSAWVVYNINGNVIGVADSYGKALSIYEARYGDTPKYPDESINKFEVNRLHYA
jgi:hypothetical protein